MKAFFIVPVLLVSFCTLLPAQNESLKVVSYNIWNGFDWGKDTEREKAMVSWLKTQEADVIAFQELNAFTPEKLEELARQWGHPYTLLLKEESYPIGISSKTPLKLKSRMLGGFWHGMLHAETRGIDFLVVHLSPHNWQFRRSEAEIIATYIEKVIKENGLEKYIVLGDFNSHSPFDAGFDVQNPETLKANQKADSLRLAENGTDAHQTLRNGSFDYMSCPDFCPCPSSMLCSWPALGVGVWKHSERTSFPSVSTGNLSAP